MEHKICRENLSAYLDGELPADEKLSLESHLAACADCSRELAELKKVSAVFKKNVMEPVPYSLKDAVFAPRERTVFSRWARPVAAFAAAGALLILALPTLREQKQAYSPAVFQAVATGGAAASAGPGPAAFGARRNISVPDHAGAADAAEAAGSPKYAAPSFSKKGAFAQAKFSAAARSATGAVRGSASSLAGGSDDFFGEAAGQGALAAAAKPAHSPAQPKWVNDLIRRHQQGPRGNPPYTIWQYSYKGAEVYYLPPQCCDQYSELYDAKGGLLCAPDGGMGGRGDGKCLDFYELRKNGRLVWQDARGAR